MKGMATVKAGKPRKKKINKEKVRRSVRRKSNSMNDEFLYYKNLSSYDEEVKKLKKDVRKRLLKAEVARSSSPKLNLKGDVRKREKSKNIATSSSKRKFESTTVRRSLRLPALPSEHSISEKKNKTKSKYDGHKYLELSNFDNSKLNKKYKTSKKAQKSSQKINSQRQDSSNLVSAELSNKKSDGFGKDNISGERNATRETESSGIRSLRNSPALRKEFILENTTRRSSRLKISDNTESGSKGSLKNKESEPLTTKAVDDTISENEGMKIKKFIGKAKLVKISSIKDSSVDNTNTNDQSSKLYKNHKTQAFSSVDVTELEPAKLKSNLFGKKYLRLSANETPLNDNSISESLISSENVLNEANFSALIDTNDSTASESVMLSDKREKNVSDSTLFGENKTAQDSNSGVRRSSRLVKNNSFTNYDWLHSDSLAFRKRKEARRKATLPEKSNAKSKFSKTEEILADRDIIESNSTLVSANNSGVAESTKISVLNTPETAKYLQTDDVKMSSTDIGAKSKTIFKLEKNNLKKQRKILGNKIVSKRLFKEADHSATEIDGKEINDAALNSSKVGSTCNLVSESTFDSIVENPINSEEVTTTIRKSKFGHTKDFKVVKNKTENENIGSDQTAENDNSLFNTMTKMSDNSAATSTPADLNSRNYTKQRNDGEYNNNHKSSPRKLRSRITLESEEKPAEYSIDETSVQGGSISDNKNVLEEPKPRKRKVLRNSDNEESLLLAGESRLGKLEKSKTKLTLDNLKLNKTEVSKEVDIKDGGVPEVTALSDVVLTKDDSLKLTKAIEKEILKDTEISGNAKKSQLESTNILKKESSNLNDALENDLESNSVFSKNESEIRETFKAVTSLDVENKSCFDENEINVVKTSQGDVVRYVETGKYKIGLKVIAPATENKLHSGEIMLTRIIQNKEQYFVHFPNLDRRLDSWFSRNDIFVDDGTAAISNSSAYNDKLVQEKSPEKRMTRRRKIILEETHHVPTSFEDMDPTTAALEKAHFEINKIKYIEQIEIGMYSISVWYFSPYPYEYGKMSMLYICESCLKYMKYENTYFKHLEKCKFRLFNEIYTKDNISVYEVDGAASKLYCQNLCLLSKLFLDHKTLYFDVGCFYFYVLFERDEYGEHICGYFSKEKNSVVGNNLSCIMILPPHQRKGYGKFLISLSYELSRLEGKIGSPEKPLSDLGKLSYRGYWSWVLLDYIRKHRCYFITIEDLSNLTGIKTEDVEYTMKVLGLLKYWKGQYSVCASYTVVDEFLKSGHCRPPRIVADRSCLMWSSKLHPQKKK